MIVLEGLRWPTKAELAALALFEREMKEHVVPKIIRAVAEREARAAMARLLPLVPQ